MIHAPVCGVDGQTYGNACGAEVAGVAIAYEGECQGCGGLTGLACGADEWCDYPERGPSCGIADGEGTCRPRPEACYDVWLPVCGCDGQTYGNDCEAAAAGTDVDYMGPCEGGGGGVCGGWSGRSCREDEFCAFVGEMCDWADAQGSCQPRPEVCPDVVNPVCGCDGQAYGNLCEAQQAGVDAAYAGPCR